MQYNVNGDDEALSLTTVKETEGLNHMRQHVEDHQQIDKEFMQPTVAKRAGNGKAHSKNTRITAHNAQRTLLHSLNGAKIKPVRPRSSNSGI